MPTHRRRHDAAGLYTIIRALGGNHDDETVRAITGTIFDSLYRSLRRETLGGDRPV